MKLIHKMYKKCTQNVHMSNCVCITSLGSDILPKRWRMDERSLGKLKRKVICSNLWM